MSRTSPASTHTFFDSKPIGHSSDMPLPVRKWRAEFQIDARRTHYYGPGPLTFLPTWTAESLRAHRFRWPVICGSTHLGTCLWELVDNLNQRRQRLPRAGFQLVYAVDSSKIESLDAKAIGQPKTDLFTGLLYVDYPGQSGPITATLVQLFRLEAGDFLSSRITSLSSDNGGRLRQRVQDITSPDSASMFITEQLGMLLDPMLRDRSAQSTRDDIVEYFDERAERALGDLRSGSRVFRDYLGRQVTSRQRHALVVAFRLERLANDPIACANADSAVVLGVKLQELSNALQLDVYNLLVYVYRLAVVVNFRSSSKFELSPDEKELLRVNLRDTPQRVIDRTAVDEGGSM